MNDFVLETCKRKNYKSTLKLLEKKYGKLFIQRFERFFKFKKKSITSLPISKLSFEVFLIVNSFNHAVRLT